MNQAARDADQSNASYDINSERHSTDSHCESKAIVATNKPPKKKALPDPQDSIFLESIKQTEKLTTPKISSSLNDCVHLQDSWSDYRRSTPQTMVTIGRNSFIDELKARANRNSFRNAHEVLEDHSQPALQNAGGLEPYNNIRFQNLKSKAVHCESHQINFSMMQEDQKAKKTDLTDSSVNFELAAPRSHSPIRKNSEFFQLCDNATETMQVLENQNITPPPSAGHTARLIESKNMRSNETPLLNRVELCEQKSALKNNFYADLSAAPSSSVYGNTEKMAAPTGYSKEKHFERSGDVTISCKRNRNCHRNKNDIYSSISWKCRRCSPFPCAQNEQYLSSRSRKYLKDNGQRVPLNRNKDKWRPSAKHDNQKKRISLTLCESKRPSSDAQPKTKQNHLPNFLKQKRCLSHEQQEQSRHYTSSPFKYKHHSSPVRYRNPQRVSSASLEHIRHSFDRYKQTRQQPLNLRERNHTSVVNGRDWGNCSAPKATKMSNNYNCRSSTTCAEMDMSNSLDNRSSSLCDDEEFLIEPEQDKSFSNASEQFDQPPTNEILHEHKRRNYRNNKKLPNYSQPHHYFHPTFSSIDSVHLLSEMTSSSEPAQLDKNRVMELHCNGDYIYSDNDWDNADDCKIKRSRSSAMLLPKPSFETKQKNQRNLSLKTFPGSRTEPNCSEDFLLAHRISSLEHPNSQDLSYREKTNRLTRLPNDKKFQKSSKRFAEDNVISHTESSLDFLRNLPSETMLPQTPCKSQMQNHRKYQTFLERNFHTGHKSKILHNNLSRAELKKLAAKHTNSKFSKKNCSKCIKSSSSLQNFGAFNDLKVRSRDNFNKSSGRVLKQDNWIDIQSNNRRHFAKDQGCCCEGNQIDKAIVDMNFLRGITSYSKTNCCESNRSLNCCQTTEIQRACPKVLKVVAPSKKSKLIFKILDLTDIQFINVTNY